MTGSSGPARRQERALELAFALLLAIAVCWLGYEFWRLLFQPGSAGGAVDVRLRRLEAATWFAGGDTYREFYDAVYPPASYLMLWPFVGWMDVALLRWLWAALSVITLWLLARLFAQHGGATTARERRLLWGLPLATYPVGATIGNGQLGIAVVACILAALPRLESRARSWSRDLSVAGLFLVALVKPSVSAHFFWIVLFAGGVRCAGLVVVGYAVLTALATLPQDRTLIELLSSWMHRAVEGSAWSAKHGGGSIATDGGALRITSINLHSVLGFVGGGHLITAASLAVLLLAGAWTWLHRRSSVWHLLGVVAVVSRFAGSHGWYDDVVMLVPLVALLRLAKGDRARWRRPAGWLALATALSLLAPGGVYALPALWSNVYVVAQAALWLAVMVFLGASATRDRRRQRARSPGSGSDQ